jgi:predicted metal-dependent hydrolase
MDQDMSLFKAPYAHGDRLETAGHPVRLAVNPRARRVSLRVDRVKREVVAIAPSARRLAEAVAFAKDKSDWIAAQLADLPAPSRLAPGGTITLFGETIRLEAGPDRARLKDGVLSSPDDAAYADRAVRLIKTEARRVLTERTALYAGRLGKPEPKLSIMDAKGRWGSCKGGLPGQPGWIRYSWRLALAPFAVADYVAAHECAHLVEANHSPRFWAVVKTLIGDPSPHRAWLRAEGSRLHAFGR